MPSTNGVIITVYVESPTLRPLKKNELNPFSKKPKTSSTSHGYDRRARLLAYARDLRTEDSGQQLPGKNSRLNLKKWKWPTFLWAKRSWNYERMRCEEDKCTCRRRKTKPGRTNSKFWRKLKRMLEGLSCCRCNKA